MSNVEEHPVQTVGHAADAAAPGALDVLRHRMVPLGGPRAMEVRRTIPQRRRSLIGPFCFLDHFGPDDEEPTRHAPDEAGAPEFHEFTAETAPEVPAPPPGMDVPPHPHIGLQTVTWLFEGRIEHRDSVGTALEVHPGQLNLMTAGRGVSHSEQSPRARRPAILHGVQMWTVLPDAVRHHAPFFEHHANLPLIDGQGSRVTVIMGGLGRAASPASVFSPLVCAQIDLEAGAEVSLEVKPGFEHGLLLDTGRVLVAGAELDSPDLTYLAVGREHLTVTNHGGRPARLMLIGGAPFTEEILMWWNFVGRSHEEIVEARDAWQAGLTRRAASADPDSRFGRVNGYIGAPLPAPALPQVRLMPRNRL